jgi:tRNA-specific 2-thiouridylase
MRIVVAMSGGVDSSVAAALLAEQGHDVVGVSMQLYDQTGGERSFGSCCTIDDLHDARRVAAAIDVPHYILNFEREFDNVVVSNFVREYTAGRTPLPCAHCNSSLKFATLADRARGFGADALATGHYARVDRDPATGRYRLARGLDPAKDQSYFLFSLTQQQLARAIFPVGGWPKAAVREYARRRRLPVADKPDSQEICFIPGNDYADFVATHASSVPPDGAIVDQQGRVLAHHRGIHRFTVGQRKGLGLGSSPTGAPMYVLELRPARQQVVVGPRSSLERTTLVASAVNWIAENDGSRRVSAQIRHRHRPAAALVHSMDGGRAEVVFDEPQVAISPGQAVVFYDGDDVVGGGWID